MGELIRIAVIDDDWYWRSELSELFTSLRCDVYVFSTYAELKLALDGGCSFHLSICDVRIGRELENGVDWVSKLDERDRCCLGRIVFFSTSKAVELQRDFPCEYMTKTFNYKSSLESLVDTLRSA